jgi:hypothetical protein
MRTDERSPQKISRRRYALAHADQLPSERLSTTRSRHDAGARPVHPGVVIIPPILRFAFGPVNQAQENRCCAFVVAEVAKSLPVGSLASHHRTGNLWLAVRNHRWQPGDNRTHSLVIEVGDCVSLY